MRAEPTGARPPSSSWGRRRVPVSPRALVVLVMLSETILARLLAHVRTSKGTLRFALVSFGLCYGVTDSAAMQLALWCGGGSSKDRRAAIATVSAGFTAGAFLTPMVMAVALADGSASNDGAYAGFKGGALTAYGSDVTISDSEFSDCYAEGSSSDSNNWTGSGGALFLSDTPSVISGSTFDTNSSENVGGAIYTDNDLSLSSCSFQTNESPYGAALYLDDNSSDIDNTDFTENKATHPEAQSGGETTHPARC